MKARHKRIALILGALAALGLIAAFVLNALNDNLAFFYSPTDVKNGKAPQNKVFRIGGLVQNGTLTRQPDGVTMAFVVTDTIHDIPVRYKGILPDLFQEGKGVVAQGKLGEDGIFTANEVLAKHDENYMPPEAAQALEKAHQAGSGNAEAKTVIPANGNEPAAPALRK
ncbi:cytochrome c maturation protein CcmE [Azovibrio restrictus]|uniref:cytochrome c maturation protein CcmE n=1 Tax=Azovibrio restrictus TaxID=146938 RepID=UPI0026F1FD59|nr:cytochrome c maturation protein CcmE [Azovibrio restrictus]MDD3483081.1 cytochrome c maturation protein CcmE [Azovibrio restrictus]